MKGIERIVNVNQPDKPADSYEMAVTQLMEPILKAGSFDSTKHLTARIGRGGQVAGVVARLHGTGGGAIHGCRTFRGQSQDWLGQHRRLPDPVPAVRSLGPPFTDVPAAHPHADFINLLRRQNVTAGCSATEYGPGAVTTRGQMAVFIIRSLLGGDSFPFVGEPFFTDVPAAHPYFQFVQKMRELGITPGCTAPAYCPDAPVTRGEMAVFLIRARLWADAPSSFPYPDAPFFADVGAAHPYFAFVQKMKQLAGELDDPRTNGGVSGAGVLHPLSPRARAAATSRRLRMAGR